MDIEVQGEFSLGEFSIRALEFVPEVNCILASNGCGEIASINVVTGSVQKFRDVGGVSGCPALLGYHGPSGKVLVASGGKVGARRAYKDTFLLKTVLQGPANNKTDDIAMEIPTAMVPSLKLELTGNVFRSQKACSAKEILEQLTRVQLSSDTSQSSTCVFTASVEKLCTLFTHLHSKLKGQMTGTPGNKGLPVKSSLLVAGLALRSSLLHPEHRVKWVKGEESVLNLGIADTYDSNVEALRRLSLMEWPHMEYRWALPQTMAEAGFFRMANPQGVNVVGNGDRVTCFACRVFLYSWEPSDEPWSEHERHLMQCPFIRGESTDNVPISLTDASHPAIQVLEDQYRDQVVCLGTSYGSHLGGVATEQGHVILLDLIGKLTISVRGSVHMTADVVDQWLQDPTLGPGLGAMPPQPLLSTDSQEDGTSTVTWESGGDVIDEVSEGDNGAASRESRPEPSPSGTGSKNGDEVKTSLDSDVPMSKHQVRITCLSILKLNSQAGTPQPLASSDAGPTKTSACSTSAADTSTTVDMSSRQTSHSPSSTFLLTALTKTVSRSSGGRDQVPVLVVHRCLEEPQQNLLKKSSSTVGEGGGEGVATPVGSQTVSISVLQALGSLESDIPNAVNSSMFAREKKSVVLEIADVIPFVDMACSEESGCVPQISQVMPLDSRSLLVVVCRTLNQLTKEPTCYVILYQILEEKMELKLVCKESFQTPSVCVVEVELTDSNCGVFTTHDSIDDMLVEDSDKQPPEGKTTFLACITSSGDLHLLDVSTTGFKRVGSAHCGKLCRDPSLVEDDVVGEEKFVQCVFCPGSNQVVVGTSSGRLLSLKLGHKNLGQRLEDLGDSDGSISWSLDEEDFDHMLSLVRTSSKGVPISCTCPVDWNKISLEKVSRKSPMHVNPPPEAGEGQSSVSLTVNDGPHWQGNTDNSVILQYEAPLSTRIAHMYEFEVCVHPSEVRACGSVCVRLNFANKLCISDNATISLLVPRWSPDTGSRGDSPKPWHQVICGPVRLKPLIDVTEQSLQVVLVHPRLMAGTSRVLILQVESLFSSQYNSVAYYEDSVAGASDVSARRRWRDRAFRHQVPASGSEAAVGSFPVKATLTVSVYPLASPSLMSSPISLDQLWCSSHSSSFLLRLVLTASRGQVADIETSALPAPLMAEVTDGRTFSRSLQERALDLLLWACLVHIQNGERGGAAGLTRMYGSVGKLLVSLLCACYVKGTRLSAHKCSRLLILLYRGGLDETSGSLFQFRQCLSTSFTRLLPLLPHFRSAACVHWFLRMVVIGTSSCDLRNTSSICVQMLVDLARALTTRQSLPAHILHTHFNHESSVFEADLFDIYLSYLHKPNFTLSTTSKAKVAYTSSLGNPSASPATVGTYSVSPSDMLLSSSADLGLSPSQIASVLSLQDSSTQVQFEGLSNVAVPSVVSKPSPSQPGSSLVPSHVATDRSPHSIYDFELQLLLDSSKKKSDLEKAKLSSANGKAGASNGKASKTIYDFPTYKHGSFLLYNQRGLLETLPLSYTCVSIAGSASVLEPSVYTMQQIPEPLPQSHQSLGAGSISKTSGYKYPSSSEFPKTSGDSGGASIPDYKADHLSSSAAPPPLPQILSNISSTPKELVMQIDSLKSGMAYSAVIKFVQPVLLTDLSIPSTNNMASVSVDVWLHPQDQASPIRIAQSAEVKSKSVMLGMLSPPTPCQFVKITFLGSLTNSREAAEFLIGSFYGIPLPSTSDHTPTAVQLHTLEEQFLSQYYLHRDSLNSALVAYHSHHGNPSGVKRYEDQVNYDYYQCYKTQVGLARLRNVMAYLNPSDDASRVFILTDGSDVNYASLSISKLSKLVGTLLNTTLSLNFGLNSETFEENFDGPQKLVDISFTRHLRADCTLEDEGLEEDLGWGCGQVPMVTREDCRVLFLMLCIQGTPQMHARTIALLINFGGAQKWWGEFVVQMLQVLFGGKEIVVFNKERALLQLSALCLHTYSSSNLLICLFNFLLQLLAPFLSDSAPSSDTPPSSAGVPGSGVLQWVVLLLTHFLSTVVLPSSQSSIFMPDTVPMASDCESHVPLPPSKIDSSSSANSVPELPGYRSVRIIGGNVVDYQDVVPTSHPTRKSSPSAASAPSSKSGSEVTTGTSSHGPVEPVDPVLLALPQDLCHSVVRGLLSYILSLCSSENDAKFTPVVSKCICLILSSTKWSYPLHTLLEESDLLDLLRSASFSITATDNVTATTSVELQRAMLQNVFSALLYYGEVRPCVSMVKAAKPQGEIPARQPEARSSLVSSFTSPKEVKDANKVESIPYNAFIISNCLEYRSRNGPESMAELHLQKVSKAIYGSVLLALMHVKPVALKDHLQSDVLAENRNVEPVVKDKFLQDLELGNDHVFPRTLGMLTGAMETLLKQATAFHQLVNETDVIAVLALWHKCNGVLSSSLEPQSSADKPNATSQPYAYLATSKLCFSTLVDFLLSQSFISPAVWQSSLVCVLGNLRSKLSIKYDRLLALLVRFFHYGSSAVAPGLARRVMTAVLPLYLYSPSRDTTLSGGCLLLEILVTILQKRDGPDQTSPLVHELCHCLVVPSTVSVLWHSKPAGLPLLLQLLHTLCELCTDILPDTLGVDCFPGVELYGGELDNVVKRKYHYNLPTDLYKYFWNRTSSEVTGHSGLSSDLWQLLMALFDIELPTSVEDAIQQYCTKTFGERSPDSEASYLALADAMTKGLVLVLADSKLLLKFLQVFNLISAQSGKSKSKETSVYARFIMFMCNNCRDPSCIFQPIQHILSSTPSGSRFSSQFISLIMWDPVFQTKQESCHSQAADFIQCGGGRVILKCLMDSTSNRQSGGVGGVTGRQGLSRQLMSNLGLKDSSLKTINPSSGLINFGRVATYAMQSSKGTRRLAPPVSSGRYSSYFFMHSFMLKEKFVKLLVTFPCPILLHNFMFLVMLETGGKTSGIPSKVCMHSSIHSSPESMVPVTPVFKTNGLDIVNLAFHQPILTQHLAVYFYRSDIHPSVAVSKVEILGTLYGNSAEPIGPKTKTLPPREKENQSSGWMDIVDKWLSSPVTAAALRPLLGGLPELLPNSLSLLATPTTKKFRYQLENLLLCLADVSPDAGLAILQHLMGFPTTAAGQGAEVPPSASRAESSFSFRLLTELCTPSDEATIENDLNRQRLSLALRLLSNLPASEFPTATHLPFLVCSLSHIIWTSVSIIKDISSAETFHSLVELSFSLDPQLQYKRALDALLCSLCRMNPEYFSMLLASCSNVLVKDVEEASRLLSTLSQCAKSNHCCGLLLESDLVGKMVARLTNGFEKLLDLLHQPISHDRPCVEESLVSNARDSLKLLCVLLAFFTDFLRNWMMAKKWMAKEENHRFWSPMLRFLSMNTFIVTSHEIAYVQEVTMEFFSVCLQACHPTKVAFVRLVCDVLQQNRILTAFLHRLLVGLVFRHDSVPIIVCLAQADPRKEVVQTLSLPLTYETLDYHPSQPTGDSCYIVYIPLSSNLTKLDTLIKSHHVNKPQPASILKSSDRTASRRVSKVVPQTEESSSLPSANSTDLDNFDIKGWKESEMSKENQAPASSHGSAPVSKSTLFCAALFSINNALKCSSLSSFIRHSISGTIFSADVHIKHLQPHNYCRDFPLVAVMDQSAILFRGQHTTTRKGEDMFNLVVSANCLQPLASCLPTLYSYHWPASLKMDAPSESDEGSGDKSPDIVPRGILRPHIVLNPVTVIPFHSLLMLGLCLQLDNYGGVMGGNPSGAFILMRLLLGEGIKDSVPKVGTELLSCIPYLLFRWMLRKFPGHNEPGQRLRATVHQLGILQHVMQCLSNSSHQPPRIDPSSDGGVSKEGVSGPTNFDSSFVQPKRIASSMDKQYWAKGTGFGTGSTASSHTISAARAKHQLEEKYVSICFTIVSEYLQVKSRCGSGENNEEGVAAAPQVAEGEKKLDSRESGSRVVMDKEGTDGQRQGGEAVDFCSVEVVDLLCSSCLLPSLATCLLNDSVLDISKHVELYNSALTVLSSLATNPATRHLLTLPVFSPTGEGGISGGVTSLASLLAKLRGVALIYQKTVRLNEKEKALPRKVLDSVGSATSLSKVNFPPPILRKPLKPSKTAPSEPDHLSDAKDTAEPEKSEAGQVLAVLTDVVTSSEVGDALTPIISTVTEELQASLVLEKTESKDGSVVTAPADSGSDTESSNTTATAGTPTVDVEDSSTADTIAVDSKSSVVTVNTTATPNAQATSTVAAPILTDDSHTSTDAPPTSTNAPPTSTIASPSSTDVPLTSTVALLPSAVAAGSSSSSVDTVAQSVAGIFLSVTNGNAAISTPIASKPSAESIACSESAEEGKVLANLFRELSQSGEVQDGGSKVKLASSVLESAGSSAVELVSSDDSNGHSSRSELAGGQTMADSKLDVGNLSKEEEEEEVAAGLVTDVLHKAVKPGLEPAIGKPGASSTASVNTKFFPLPDSPPPPIPPRAPIPKKLYALRRKGPKPAYKSDAADKVEVVAKILSVSALVADVVKRLKEESGSFSRQGSVSTPLTEASQGDGEAYMSAMRPLQFETCVLVEEDDGGKMCFPSPFHYQSQVESATSAVHYSARSRRLAQEISTLASSLPLSPSSSVFVRCDEERLDVMKVLITGPSDTPYANGCFEFDVFFPSNYPKGPMLINLKTTGHGRVRFNPNLYNDGKVCLSVLNTWHGRPEEKWNAQTSSFLQVLVSIQSLILVPEPYFNEPGYEQSRGTAYGDQRSLAYNSNISVATIQWAMINQIRNPTPCFKKVILQHFFLRKEHILVQCGVWRKELEEALKGKSADPSRHILKDQLHSLAVSIETLKLELEKLKEDDFKDED